MYFTLLQFYVLNMANLYVRVKFKKKKSDNNSIPIYYQYKSITIIKSAISLNKLEFENFVSYMCSLKL